MKTGILTYHSVPNFGANLQALSTVGFLKKQGHEPIIINWVPEGLELKYKQTVSESQRECTNKFCVENFPMTEICRNNEDVANVIRKYGIERIFIGSDAVWNYVPLNKRIRFSFRRLKFVKVPVTKDHDYPNPFWGCFDKSVNDIPAAAFSVSSQNMPFSAVKGLIKEQIGISLRRLKKITVRDEWTKQLVEYFTDNLISPNVTPDPVFGFNSNIPVRKTKEEILKKFNLPDKYILFSFRIPRIDSNWAKAFEQICNSKGYACIGFPMPEKLIPFGLEQNINLPLDTLDWYYLIKYASGYVGERMHPIIVALHNAVPFYCFDEYGLRSRFGNCDKIRKSSKIYDILSKADLLGHWFSYRTMKNLPAPAEVVNKLLTFDVQKCTAFSISQERRYNEAMTDILNNL